MGNEGGGGEEGSGIERSRGKISQVPYGHGRQKQKRFFFFFDL